MVGDSNGILFEWNIATDETTEPLVLHQANRISDLEFSSDGSLLASAGWDGTVELLTGSPLVPLASLVSPTVQPGTAISRSPRVYSVSFSPDGERLAIGGERFPVTLWNVARIIHSSIA